VSALVAVTASIVCDPLIGGNGEPWMISSMLVVPYPPGFPVLVPGQMISKEILYFLAQLDVKEIHGYNPDLGLSVFTEAAIARLTATHGKADAHAPPGTQASITLTD
jgi:arginine decarboxylase